MISYLQNHRTSTSIITLISFIIFGFPRVKCHYNADTTFKIDAGSNPNYIAFAIEHLNGDGDVGSVELLPSNSKGWIAMQQSWGATWKRELPVGTKGPFSVRLTTIQTRKRIVANHAIPANWAPGQRYHSKIAHS